MLCNPSEINSSNHCPFYNLIKSGLAIETQRAYIAGIVDGEGCITILPLSDLKILTFPNPYSFYNCIVYRLIRDIMSTKWGAYVFFLRSQDSVSTAFPGPNLKSNSQFFAPNLNLHLALLSAILLTNIFLLLWWDWLFLICSIFTGMTDKGKPFERMGRKTTDLSNGGWVAELISRISSAHSFEVKTGLFFMRNLGANRRSRNEHLTESCDQAHRA